MSEKDWFTLLGGGVAGSAITLIVGFLVFWAAIQRLRTDKEIAVLKNKSDLEIENVRREKEEAIEKLRREHQLEIADNTHRRNLEAEYDKDLRKMRIEAYQTLLKIIQPFTMRHVEMSGRHDSKIETINYLHEMIIAITKWHVEIGSLLLSNQSQKILINYTVKVMMLIQPEILSSPELPLSDTLMPEIGRETDILTEQLKKDIGSDKTITYPSSSEILN